MDIKNTIFVNQAFASAQRKAESYRHEFIMPEHLLSAIIEQEAEIFAAALMYLLDQRTAQRAAHAA